MRKFALILGLVLSLGVNACVQNDVNKQEFVNPIFYQPLRPMSIHSGYVYLSPTSIKFMTPLDKEHLDATGLCELVENEKNFIKLSCKVRWQKIQASTMIINSDDHSSLWYCTYEVKGLFFDNCLDVEENIYVIKEGNKEKISTSHFCVSPSASPSESD
ncbi:MAG: hypothetical protein IKN67_00090 [Alphaproteobacteria bacterium]|nr:hypothetical protein [Alphaproteobacteria bacterium]